MHTSLSTRRRLLRVAALWRVDECLGATRNLALRARLTECATVSKAKKFWPHKLLCNVADRDRLRTRPPFGRPDIAKYRIE